MKQITSRENPIAKQAASLKVSKYRKIENMFLLEGERSVREIGIKSDRLVRCFIQDDLLERYQSLIQEMDDEKVYLVSERVMQSICDTGHPQGIAAVVSKKEWALETVIERRGLWVMMNGIADPGNLGTMIRSCWALGGQGIILAANCADPYNSKVIRASMGGVLHLPIISQVSLDEVQGLQNKGYVLAGTAIDASIPYYQADLKGDLIIVIGSEAHGVDPILTGICNQMLLIPMKTGVNSLNAASACAIILSEALKQRNDSFLF